MFCHIDLILKLAFFTTQLFSVKLSGHRCPFCCKSGIKNIKGRFWSLNHFIILCTLLFIIYLITMNYVRGFFIIYLITIELCENLKNFKWMLIPNKANKHCSHVIVVCWYLNFWWNCIKLIPNFFFFFVLEKVVAWVNITTFTEVLSLKFKRIMLLEAL